MFFDILLSDQRTRKGYPVLQKTVLGWILSGKTPAVNSSSSTQRSFFLREITPLEANLNRFWEVQPEPCSTFTPEQQACEQHFLNHTHQKEDGRFIRGRRKYTGQAQPLFLTVIVIIDVSLKRHVSTHMGHLQVLPIRTLRLKVEHVKIY